MKNPTPRKRLRVAMNSTLAAVRQVQTLADGPMPDLEGDRRELSRLYARLRKRLEEQEARP